MGFLSNIIPKGGVMGDLFSGLAKVDDQVITPIVNKVVKPLAAAAANSFLPGSGAIVSMIPYGSQGNTAVVNNAAGTVSVVTPSGAPAQLTKQEATDLKKVSASLGYTAQKLPQNVAVNAIMPPAPDEKWYKKAWNGYTDMWNQSPWMTGIFTAIAIPLAIWGLWKGICSIFPKCKKWFK